MYAEYAGTFMMALAVAHAEEFLSVKRLGGADEHGRMHCTMGQIRVDDSVYLRTELSGSGVNTSPLQTVVPPFSVALTTRTLSLFPSTRLPIAAPNECLACLIDDRSTKRTCAPRSRREP